MIYHVVPKDEWLASIHGGTYRCRTIMTDGFIHCATQEQVIDVVNKHFWGRRDLSLVCINPAKVIPRIVYEDLYKTNLLYPHIYGQLNLDAVSQEVDLTPLSDGTFVWPDQVKF